MSGDRDGGRRRQSIVLCVLAAVAAAVAPCGTIVSLEDLFAGEPEQAGSPSGDSSSSGTSSSSGGSAGASSSSSGSSTTSSGSSFAKIVNTNRLTITVAISEADIGQIKVGQPATRTEIASGLKAGDELVVTQTLPSLSSGSASSTSTGSSGTLGGGSGLGAGGLGAL
jgi:hypothetical protein